MMDCFPKLQELLFLLFINIVGTVKPTLSYDVFKKRLLNEFFAYFELQMSVLDTTFVTT
jgi:hypothetical protein